MKIYHNQLNTTLQQGIKPVWLVFGDEPWQKNDSLQQIKHFTQQQGYSELIRFSVDDKFDWQVLQDEFQSLSLFANRRIIEVELTSIKIGDKGNKALLTLSEQLTPDIILILHGPRLDAAASKRKWVKTLTDLGCYLPLYDLEGKALQQWLYKQAKQYQLNLEPSIFPLLIELFEGNVLALDQELQKLSILYQQQAINFNDADQLLSKQTKFNPFQLIDAMLLGDLNKVIRILDQQQQEGSAIGQLIWFIHKELNQLIAMHEKKQQHINMADIYKQYRIWDKRKPLYQYALTQSNLSNCTKALSRLSELDLLNKTSSDFNPFVVLADICISIYHGETLNNLPLNYEFN